MPPKTTSIGDFCARGERLKRIEDANDSFCSKITEMNSKINTLQVEVAELKTTLDIYAKVIGSLIIVFIGVLGWTLTTISNTNSQIATLTQQLSFYQIDNAKTR